MKAQLLLEDGTNFEAEHFGAPVPAPEKVVFNVGMVGYPEAMTAASHRGQISIITYPLTGKYGIPVDSCVCNHRMNSIVLQGRIGRTMHLGGAR